MRASARQRGFSYSPSTVINPGVFVSHLFLRPGYGHYYFGDYYGSNYAECRVFPVVLVPLQPPRLRSDLCQPALAASAATAIGSNAAKTNYRNYRDNEDARPPRNWAAQRELAGRGETCQQTEHRGCRAARRAGPEKRHPVPIPTGGPAGTATVWPAWARVPQVPPAAAAVGSQCGAHARRRSCQSIRAGTTAASQVAFCRAARPSSSTRITLRRNDMRFSSRTSKSSPSREHVAANREHVRVLGKDQRACSKSSSSRNSRILGRGETSVHRASRSVRP